MENMMKSPLEITEGYVEIGKKKANTPPFKIILLGILAGAFIAFAAQGSNVAIHTIESVGIAKALAGALFATGLMMVVLTGAELFTGNTLIVVSVLEKKTPLSKMLKNWGLVYLGNFIGSMLIVLMILNSGQFNFTSGMLGGFTIKTAVYKTGLTFSNAFFMGILCNWLVCLAVWIASAAKDMVSKVFGIFFPIWLFITSGFEHSIANMYYIPAGILAKTNSAWVAQASSLGVSADSIVNLTWGSFVFNNLVPVTLGNIVGGAIFVGMFYWLGFLYKQKDSTTSKTKVKNFVPQRVQKDYVEQSS